MATTNYYSVNGQILGEASPKNPIRRYAADALGSVAATFNTSGALENTYRHKPYGRLLVKTGTAADPAFTWVGTLGYRQTSMSWSEVYTRSRHYSTSSARWSSVDPMWPEQLAYVYVADSPTEITDPTGLYFTKAQCIAACAEIFRKSSDLNACISICKKLGGSDCNALRARCNHLIRHPSEGSAALCEKLLGQLCPPPIRPIPVPFPFPVPEPEPRPLPKPIRVGVAVGGGLAIGALIWEGCKWGIAILAAPETGGGSLLAAGALP